MVNHAQLVARRLLSAVTTWPDRTQWWLTGRVSAGVLAVTGVIAVASGLAAWQPSLAGWPMRLLTVVIVPALSEEVVFRGLLTPTRGEGRWEAISIVFSLSAFVCWHVIEALTFLPGARLFLQPAFLVCAGLLGVACSWLRFQTGSLWPGVVLHGLLVFGWQTFFGGPGFAELMA